MSRSFSSVPNKVNREKSATKLSFDNIVPQPRNDGDPQAMNLAIERVSNLQVMENEMNTTLSSEPNMMSPT